MRKANAFWIKEILRGEIVEEILPPVKNGWWEIESLFSAVSTGTERLVFTGRVPEDLYETMRCSYMGGNFPVPVKYGYSLVGRIVGNPMDVMGRVVHLLHPHQDRVVVRSEDVFMIPHDVPPARATLASNLETAVNAVWDAQISIGEQALVVGFGAVGSLLTRVLSSIPGVKVVVVDNDSHKVNFAQKMGFTAYVKLESPGDFDLSFHTSGSEEGLQTAIDAVGIEGRVIELSWFGNQTVSLELGGTFHSHRKKIISSQVSLLPSRMKSRWDLVRRKKLVFTLLKDRRFDEHITGTISFTGLPRFFDKLGARRVEGLSFLVDYQQ
ncbi:MAG: zinc-binding alcohol dehydrogenase [Fidelibacterota bacterium]